MRNPFRRSPSPSQTHVWNVKRGTSVKKRADILIARHLCTGASSITTVGDEHHLWRAAYAIALLEYPSMPSPRECRDLMEKHSQATIMHNGQPQRATITWACYPQTITFIRIR